MSKEVEHKINANMFIALHELHKAVQRVIVSCESFSPVNYSEARYHLNECENKINDIKELANDGKELIDDDVKEFISLIELQDKINGLQKEHNERLKHVLLKKLKVEKNNWEILVEGILKNEKGFY